MLSTGAPVMPISIAFDTSAAADGSRRKPRGIVRGMNQPDHPTFLLNAFSGFPVHRTVIFQDQ
jgi:hypothetical protein